MDAGDGALDQAEEAQQFALDGGAIFDHVRIGLIGLAIDRSVTLAPPRTFFHHVRSVLAGDADHARRIVARVIDRRCSKARNWRRYSSSLRPRY